MQGYLDGSRLWKALVENAKAEEILREGLGKTTGADLEVSAPTVAESFTMPN